MKQKLYSILLLVMAMLCTGANSAWAQEEEPAEQQLSVGTQIITLEEGIEASFTFNAPANGYYNFQFSVAGSGFADYDIGNLPWGEVYVDGETTSLLVYNGVIKYNKYLESGDPHTLEIEDVQYFGDVFLQIIGGSYPSLTDGENTGYIIPAHDSRVFKYTPSESGYYTFTFSQALSSAPKIDGQTMTWVEGNTYLSQELTDTQYGYYLSVPGGTNGITSLDITIAKSSTPINIGQNTGKPIPADGNGAFDFTVGQDGYYTITFSQALSAAPTVDGSQMDVLVAGTTYKTSSLDANKSHLLSVPGGTNGYTDMTITLAKYTNVSFTLSGEQVAVGGTVSMSPATNAYPGQITYSSDKPEVATVDANGVITGVSGGTATISASAPFCHSADYSASYSGNEGYRVTVLEPGMLDRSIFSYALLAINFACESEGTTFTLTFANSYSGSAAGTSVGPEVNLYDDGNGNYVVAPTTAGTVIKVSTCGNLFSSLNKLTAIDFANFNTENVTDMQDMFNGCSSLQQLDLSGFNTSNVTTMMRMFDYCESLSSLTIGNFDMSKVTTTDDMFKYCTNLNTLTMKSLPYLLDETFNTQFSGEGKTVSVVLDDNSVVYEPYYVGDGVWANSYYPEPTVAPTYTRTIAAASLWGTVVLPFRVAAENNDVQLYFLDVVTFNDEGKGSMKFIKEKNSVYPNTPGVFKKKNATATTVTFTGAKDTETGKYAVGAIEDPYDDRGSYGSDYWYMYGTYSEKTDVVQEGLNSPTKYTTYFIAQDKFWWAEKDITVAPFRAWFWYYSDEGGDDYDGGDGGGDGDGGDGGGDPGDYAPARSFNIVEADDTEGIELISDTDGTLYMVNGQCLDLQGRQVGKGQKGLQIREGRVVFLR